ncbi:hypothetical protein D3C78_1274430 [compost metagenome]
MPALAQPAPHVDTVRAGRQGDATRLGSGLLLRGQVTPGQQLQTIAGLQADQARQTFPVEHARIQLPEITGQDHAAFAPAFTHRGTIALRALGLKAQGQQRLPLPRQRRIAVQIVSHHADQQGQRQQGQPAGTAQPAEKPAAIAQDAPGYRQHHQCRQGGRPGQSVVLHDRSSPTKDAGIMRMCVHERPARAAHNR